MSNRLAIALTLALAAMSAHAQTTPDNASVMTQKDTAVLPVWNNHSGKVEALLLLEPAQRGGGSLFGAGARVNTGHGLLQGSLSVDNGSGLALLCNSRTGLATLGSLADRCLLASLDAQTQSKPDSPFVHMAQSLRAEARFERPESLFEVSAGRAQFDTTPIDWFSPSSGLLPGLGILSGRVSQQDISARGKMNIGDFGWVSIGGTLAHARLVPTGGQAGNPQADRWNTTSVGVAVGRGKLSGEVIGRVVDVPGQSASLNSLGIGLSWETPWRGKLSFGAEKSKGTVPLGPAGKTTTPQQDEDTVPYVRYHQDL